MSKVRMREEDLEEYEERFFNENKFNQEDIDEYYAYKDDYLKAENRMNYLQDEANEAINEFEYEKESFEDWLDKKSKTIDYIHLRW